MVFEWECCVVSSLNCRDEKQPHRGNGAQETQEGGLRASSRFQTAQYVLCSMYGDREDSVVCACCDVRCMLLYR